MPTLEQPSDLRNKLAASLVANSPVWTVGEFVNALLAQTNWNDALDSIEFGIGPDGRRVVTVGRGDHGIEVREKH